MSKTMKILRLIIPFVVASIIIVAIANMRDSDVSRDINLYFFNRDKSTITATKHEIQTESENGLYDDTAELLIKGPSDKKHSPIMDKNVTVNRIRKSDEGLNVDFSSEYDYSNPLTTYAVIKTFCQFNDIGAVLVTVEGKDVLGRGYIKGDDIILESDDDSATGITLYFADASKTKLTAEYRKISITDTRPIEQYIINELLKGPNNKDNVKLLSSDTGVISVETTDGTCYVNFKQDFISKNTSSDEINRLTVYSIVNSLTERGNISNVQFLIDGKKTEKFGNMNISDLFYRNENM